MASDHDIDTKPKRSKAAAFVGASLSSILSGNPFSRDEFYHRIRTFIENGRYTKNIQAFSTECTKFEKEHKPYDTVVIKSSHGAYLLVKTAAPALDDDGQPCNKPAYALLFSQYPEFLQDLFLKPRDENWERPAKEEIENKISVVAAHWESDIEQRNERSGEARLVKSWVKTAISKHNTNFEEHLKRHGSINRDGEKMWRSGSSIFWLREDHKAPGQYNIYYYSNPIYGQLSLFITEHALKNPISRTMMHLFSVRLSKNAMPLSKAEEFVSEQYSKIAPGIFANRDPYDVTAPEDKLSKIGRMFKKFPVRTVQQMSHAALNIDKKAFMVSSTATVVLTGIIWLAFSGVFFAAGAATKGVSSLGQKAVTGVVRKGTTFLKPPKTKAVNALNDISTQLAANKKNNFITAENAGLMLNAEYIDFMDPVQKPFLESTFPEMKPMDQVVTEDPAQAAMLNEIGVDPLAILDDKDMDDQDLQARLDAAKAAAEKWAHNKLCDAFGLEAGTDLTTVTRADLAPSEKLPHIINASDEWAKSVLLDTLGIQPGTIFTDVELDGRTFLKAQQPNGLDVYYDPEEHVAIAHVVRDPYDGFALEKPIERLFNSIPAEDYVIAIRQGEKNTLEQISVPSLDDIPEDFIRQKSKSIRQINEETVNLDEIGTFADMHLYQFVSDKEADKWRKKAEKSLRQTLEESFSAQTDIIEVKVDSYCLARTHARAAQKTITIDMPAAPAIVPHSQTAQDHNLS